MARAAPPPAAPPARPGRPGPWPRSSFQESRALGLPARGQARRRRVLSWLAFAAGAALLAAAATAEADGEAEVCPAGAPCDAVGLAAGPPPRAHHWPHARGRPGQWGFTPLPGPRNLSAALAWSWHHPTRAVVNGAVVLDDSRNLYVSAMDGVWKFSPDGAVLWHYWVTGFLVNGNPSLMGDALYASSDSGWVFALDLHTGVVLWRTRAHKASEMDSPYVEAYEGIVLSAGTRAPDKHVGLFISGNTRAVALNATDGSSIWEYKSDAVLWNFMPLSVGDGTVIAMDVHGMVLRLSLRDGRLLWTARPPSDYHVLSFTDGGAILGPGGLVYTCSNPDLEFGLEAANTGRLRAYQLSDGKFLWEQVTGGPCVSWPASDGKTVVVPVGALDKHLDFLAAVGAAAAGTTATTTPTIPRPLEVWAFDAQTGAPRWRYAGIPPWPRPVSRGDEEFLSERTARWPGRPICCPASWSAPTISSDGSVYAAATNGRLYAIRDANGDGAIDGDVEVSSLDLGAGSLHGGAAFAPGLMAFASCEGLFVFKV